MISSGEKTLISVRDAVRGDTSWGAYSPDLPGVVVVGDTPAEVEQLMRDAIPFHIAGLRDAGLPFPEPRNAAGVVAA